MLKREKNYYKKTIVWVMNSIIFMFICISTLDAEELPQCDIHDLYAKITPDSTRSSYVVFPVHIELQQDIIIGFTISMLPNFPFQFEHKLFSGIIKYKIDTFKEDTPVKDFNIYPVSIPDVKDGKIHFYKISQQQNPDGSLNGVIGYDYIAPEGREDIKKRKFSLPINGYIEGYDKNPIKLNDINVSFQENLQHTGLLKWDENFGIVKFLVSDELEEPIMKSMFFNIGGAQEHELTYSGARTSLNIVKLYLYSLRTDEAGHKCNSWLETTILPLFDTSKKLEPYFGKLLLDYITADHEYFQIYPLAISVGMFNPTSSNFISTENVSSFSYDDVRGMTDKLNDSKIEISTDDDVIKKGTPSNIEFYFEDETQYISPNPDRIPVFGLNHDDVSNVIANLSGDIRLAKAPGGLISLYENNIYGYTYYLYAEYDDPILKQKNKQFLGTYDIKMKEAEDFRDTRTLENISDITCESKITSPEGKAMIVEFGTDIIGGGWDEHCWTRWWEIDNGLVKLDPALIPRFFEIKNIIFYYLDDTGKKKIQTVEDFKIIFMIDSPYFKVISNNKENRIEALGQVIEVRVNSNGTSGNVLNMGLQDADLPEGEILSFTVSFNYIKDVEYLSAYPSEITRIDTPYGPGPDTLDIRLTNISKKDAYKNLKAQETVVDISFDSKNLASGETTVMHVSGINDIPKYGTHHVIITDETGKPLISIPLYYKRLHEENK